MCINTCLCSTDSMCMLKCVCVHICVCVLLEIIMRARKTETKHFCLYLFLSLFFTLPHNLSPMCLVFPVPVFLFRCLAGTVNSSLGITHTFCELCLRVLCSCLLLSVSPSIWMYTRMLVSTHTFFLTHWCRLSAQHTHMHVHHHTHECMQKKAHIPWCTCPNACTNKLTLCLLPYVYLACAHALSLSHSRAPYLFLYLSLSLSSCPSRSMFVSLSQCFSLFLSFLYCFCFKCVSFPASCRESYFTGTHGIACVQV